MYVIVYCNEGFERSLVYLNRRLGDHEPMDARAFAKQVADDMGLELAAPGGRIPNYSGNIRVEFTDREPSVIDERYQGSTRIWSGESFYWDVSGDLAEEEASELANMAPTDHVTEGE